MVMNIINSKQLYTAYGKGCQVVDVSELSFFDKSIIRFQFSTGRNKVKLLPSAKTLEKVN
jgi:hypothetical protein